MKKFAFKNEPNQTIFFQNRTKADDSSNVSTLSTPKQKFVL
jgi:hypothetical protein